MALLAGCAGLVQSSSAGAAVPNATFAAATTFAAGTYPYSVVLADVNGDTILDMVAAVRSDPWAVSVLLGDGLGGFGARTGFGDGDKTAVAVGDLDADGFPDLVASDATGGIGLSVLLGDGAGGFGSQVDYPDNYGIVDLADVNEDGSLDAITQRSVRLGDGVGGLGAPIALPAEVGGAWAVADVDGDGHLDLVGSNASPGAGPAVSVFAGIGDGTFESAIDLPTSQHHLSAAVADLNGDLHADIVATDYGADSVSVLLGDGAGGFGASTTFPTGIYPDSVAVGDLNGDAIPDLTVANAGAPAEFPVDGSVSVLLGNGDGTFGANTTIVSGGSFWSPRVGDLNADGRLDVVASHIQAGRVSVVLNTTPPRVSGAPIIRPAIAGNGQATVSWTPPTANGGSPITGYVVTPYIGYYPLASVTFGSTATTQVMSGLANGTAYRFRVRAINAVGTSGYSTVTNPVTPATVPGAPTILRTATAGNATATVSWTAPTSNGGSPITGYVVTPYIGYFSLPPTTFSSTSTTQTLTGLTNGTEYRFRVQAINSVGSSGYSMVTNPVTPSP